MILNENVLDTATEITSNPLNIDSLKYLKDLKVGVKINALRIPG